MPRITFFAACILPTLARYSRPILGFCTVTASVLALPQPAADNSLSNSPLFLDKSWEWGLYTQHQQRREALTGLTETLGAGACVLDFNNDGWMDALLVGGSGQRREFGAASWWQPPTGHSLYRNQAGTGFVDVSAASGLQASWGMGCASADWDSDGDEDLLITGYNSTRLYRNDGDGHFTPQQQSGISESGWATSASVADFDGDGRLDIYISTFIDYQRGQRTFEATTGFARQIEPGFQASLYAAQSNRLYRNLGELHFAEAAAVMGVANPEGRSLQGLWAHLNADSAIDLVVSNASGSPARVFLNQQHTGFNGASRNWQFSAGTGLRGLALLNAGQQSASLLLATTGPGEALAISSANPAERYNPWDHGLAEDSQLAYSGWGIRTGDFDNNGVPDIATANGLAQPDPDSPSQPLGQKNMLYTGYANAAFDAQPLGVTQESSRAVLSLDANNDGALDLLITNNNDAPQLLLNTAQASGNWLGLTFQDSNGKPISHGITATLSSDDWTRTQSVAQRQGFLSSGGPRLHFGLGENATVTQLQVSWPDGTSTLHRQPPLNKYLLIKQGAPPAPVRTGAPIANATMLEHQRLYRRFGRLYIHLLVSAAPTIDRTRFVREATLGSSRALLSALAAMPQRPHPEWFFLLSRGLAASDEAAKLSALEVAQRWELETSTRYLLPLLSEPSAEVQCRTARVFEAFFHEEEAVVQHKYLALPHLVKMLDYADPAARICAMQALSEARRFRGLHPLLKLIHSDNPAVARQAVRTLGRMRQREAIPALEALAIRLPENSELNAEISLALAQLVQATPEHSPLENRSERAILLPSKPQKIRLSPDQQAVLAGLLKNYNSPKPRDERALRAALQRLKDIQVWQVFLQTLGGASTPRAKRLLGTNLHHNNAQVTAVVIAHSDPLIQDPHYNAALWRLLVAPNYENTARTALAYKLGNFDAQRVQAQLAQIAVLYD